jgi:HEAT repeats
LSDPSVIVGDVAVTPDVTPKERIEAECRRRGKEAVVADCLALVRGETDLRLLQSVAGRGADKYFDGEEHDDLYWFRVWGMRGLLWAWDDQATPAVIEAFRDGAWRVREMAAKVAARHLVAEAGPAVAELRDDPVPRVRAAAERAVTRLISAQA